ncbi:MAG: dienelactone hydrolase family protein [Verrucomicrobiota bacterium]
MSLNRANRLVWVGVILFGFVAGGEGWALGFEDEAVDIKDGPYEELMEGEWVHSEPLAEGGLPFWIYLDRKVNDGERYPLVVVLHGRRNQAKPGEAFKVQGIATAWTEEDRFRDDRCIVVQPYYPPQGGWEKVPEQLDATLEHLFEHLPVDRERVYLFGFSNGGQGSFQIMARQPEWFAGAVTVSGPVGKDVVGKIKTPIWAWVGENDNDLNKKERVVALAEALRGSGVDVQLTVVPGAGHNIAGKVANEPEVVEWLFEQRLEE